MNVCPVCGESIKKNKLTCPVCGTNLLIKDKNINQNKEEPATRYVFSNNNWIDEGTYMSDRILRDSRIVLAIFITLGSIIILFGIIYLAATRETLISIIIFLIGAFMFLLGMIINDMMRGMSITVRNSVRK